MLGPIECVEDRGRSTNRVELEVRLQREGRAKRGFGEVGSLERDIRHGELFLEPMLTLLVQLLRKHIDTVQDSYCGSFAEWSLQASFEVSAPKTMEPNRIYEIPLTFYNNSGTTLGSKAQSGFSVGNHWCDAGGTVVQWLDGLRPLMHPLEPGNHVDLTLWVRSPHKEGIYQLEIDLEHAGSFWLSELGVKRSLSNISVL